MRTPDYGAAALIVLFAGHLAVADDLPTPGPDGKIHLSAPCEAGLNLVFARTDRMGQAHRTLLQAKTEAAQNYAAQQYADATIALDKGLDAANDACAGDAPGTAMVRRLREKFDKGMQQLMGGRAK